MKLKKATLITGGVLLILGATKCTVDQVVKENIKANNNKCAIILSEPTKVLEFENEKHRDSYVREYEAEYYTNAIIEDNVEVFTSNKPITEKVNCADYSAKQKVKVKVDLEG